jgi:hypothetical protein
MYYEAFKEFDAKSEISVCFMKDDRAIYIHGYAKNQKANISKKELEAFKRVAEILLSLPHDQIENSLKTGTFIEVVNNG